MKTLPNIDTVKPVQVSGNLIKLGCQFIARYGAKTKEIKTTRIANDQER